MLHVYGRQLPNLRVFSEVDKNLYIDIDGADLGNFAALGLPPSNTYILTTRQIKDYDYLIKCGYYNILHVGRPSEITEALISRFIQQNYSDNHFKIVAQRISELYTKTGSAIEDLSTALAALRDDDPDVFIRMMIGNVDNFLNVMDDIKTMSIFCKSVQGVSDSYAETVQRAAKLDSALVDLEQANMRYESLRTESTLWMAERQEMQSKIESLTAQINARTITSTEIQNSAEYISLAAQLESVISERNEIKQAFENYKQDASATEGINDDKGLLQLISQLQEDIRRLKEKKISDSIAEKLPIFTDNTNVQAESFICFREIRPTVYINSLIMWLNSSLRVYNRMSGKSYLILVVDQLSSYFDEAKYVKHGWNVNKITEDMTVLVVPPMRFDVLKSTYHIESYDVVVCIDRCHTMTPVVDMKAANTYNLINTCGDITDFGLDCTKCIAFMDKIPAGVPQAPKYHIPTWSEALCVTDASQRVGKLGQDGVFIDILKECGVYWK